MWHLLFTYPQSFVIFRIIRGCCLLVNFVWNVFGREKYSSDHFCSILFRVFCFVSFPCPCWSVFLSIFLLFYLSVCVKITAVCSFMWWLSHFCLCLLPVCVSKSIGIDCCVFFGDFWFPFCCHSFVVIVCVFSLDYASPHESTSHESYASHESEGEARLWRVWWVCWRAFSSSASVEFDRAD